LLVLQGRHEDARHALHQAMPAREDSDEQLFDDALLADDDFRELSLKLPRSLA
jgi:hypothetical protein